MNLIKRHLEKHYNSFRILRFVILGASIPIIVMQAMGMDLSFLLWPLTWILGGLDTAYFFEFLLIASELTERIWKLKKMRCFIFREVKVL